jgi:hypothetical protein
MRVVALTDCVFPILSKFWLGLTCAMGWHMLDSYTGMLQAYIPPLQEAPLTEAQVQSRV